jgi:hypothetical protein
MHPVQALLSMILFALALDEFFVVMSYLVFGDTRWGCYHGSRTEPMLSQLPAFLNYVLGDALSYELMVLLTFSLMLGIRRNLDKLLRWYRRQQEEPEDGLRSALWKILRGR